MAYPASHPFSQGAAGILPSGSFTVPTFPF
jgi:hypothetical protein